MENENATNQFENSKNFNVPSKLVVGMENLPLVSLCNTITKCLKTEKNVLRSSSNQNRDAIRFSEGTDIVFQSKSHLDKKSNLGLQSFKTALENSTDSSEMSVQQEIHLTPLHKTGKRFNKMLLKISTENADYIGSSEEVELFGLKDKEPHQTQNKTLVENIEFPTNISSKNWSPSDHQIDYMPSTFKDTTKINHQVEGTNVSLNDSKNFDDNKEIILLKSLNLLDLVEFKKVEKEINRAKINDCKHQRDRLRFVINNTKSKNKGKPRKTKFKENNKKRHISVSKSLFYSKNKVNNASGDSEQVLASLSKSSNKVGSKIPYKQFCKESTKNINMKSVSASNPHLYPNIHTDHSKASHVSNRQNKCALNASVSETSSCVEGPVRTQRKKAFQNLKPTILDLRILSPHTKLDFVNQCNKRVVEVPEESCCTVVKPNVKQQSVKRCLLDEFPEDENNGLAGQLIEKPVSCDSFGLSIVSSNNSQNNIKVAEESNENATKNCESICDSTDELDTVISLHSSSDEHSVLFWDSNEKSRDLVIFPSEVSRIKFDEDEQDSSSQNIYNSNFSMELTDSIPSTSNIKRKEKVFHRKHSTKQSLLAREKKKILSAVQVRHNTCKKEKVLTYKESIANKAALSSISDLPITTDKPKHIVIPLTSLETSPKTDKISLPIKDSAQMESKETRSISPSKNPIVLPDGKQNSNEVSSSIHSCDHCNKEFKSNKEYNKHNLKCHSHNLFY